MKPRTRRLLAIVTGLGACSVACALVLNAFRSNLVFFFSPTQVAAQEAPRGQPFRLGGLVEAGSLLRVPGGLTVHFTVTDTARTVPVRYTGLLPDLFQEGKGVVAQGRLGADGVFVADQVLAKHDENYMPPEAAQALADAQKHVATAGAPSAGPPRAGPPPEDAKRPRATPRGSADVPVGRGAP
jgi:cytochrome c-type biogenesis protein CcmE